MREQGLYVHIHTSIGYHVNVLSLQRNELRGKCSIWVGICRIALGKSACVLYWHIPKKALKGGRKPKEWRFGYLKVFLILKMIFPQARCEDRDSKTENDSRKIFKKGFEQQRHLKKTVVALGNLLWVHIFLQKCGHIEANTIKDKYKIFCRNMVRKVKYKICWDSKKCWGQTKGLW